MNCIGLYWVCDGNYPNEWSLLLANILSEVLSARKLFGRDVLLVAGNLLDAAMAGPSGLVPP